MWHCLQWNTLGVPRSSLSSGEPDYKYELCAPQGGGSWSPGTRCGGNSVQPRRSAGRKGQHSLTGALLTAAHGQGLQGEVSPWEGALEGLGGLGGLGDLAGLAVAIRAARGMRGECGHQGTTLALPLPPAHLLASLRPSPPALPLQSSALSYHTARSPASFSFYQRLPRTTPLWWSGVISGSSQEGVGGLGHPKARNGRSEK